MSGVEICDFDVAGRNLRFLLPLLLLAACGRSPDDSVELDTPVDAEVDAERHSTGAPCTTNEDCEGVCVGPPEARRCVAGCAGEDDCDEGFTCQEGACLPPPRPAAGEGASCAAGERCALGLRCTALWPGEASCARPCGEGCGDLRCAPPSTGEEVCLPPESVAFTCSYVGCARADLLCVEGLCLSPCRVRGMRCVQGGFCEAREGDGALVCSPRADVPVGGSCAGGGDAACVEGSTCHALQPGDPDAICSKPCNLAEECCEDCACRRPRGFAERLCVPAPFGRGDEAGGPGADCSAHGDTDCAPELDCVPGIAGARVCAAACETECVAGFTCAQRDRGAACLEGEGGVGTPCPEGAGCDAACLVELEPLDRYCTGDCVEGCPEGFFCQVGQCVVGLRGDAALGAECFEGADACASGLCALHPESGVPACTEACEEACPGDFECLRIEGSGFCFAQ